jgi:hypothetical protein
VVSQFEGELDMRTLLSLWCVAHLFFVGAWLLGYWLLPEGALRGVGVAANLPLEHLAFWLRFLGTVGANGLVGLMVALTNRVQWVRLPLAVVPVLGYWVHYGLLLGSNSFAVPLPNRVPPLSPAVLERAGYYELTAYLLVAVATAGWARWRQTGWLAGQVERLEPAPLRRMEYALLTLACLLIGVGAFIETAQWCRAAGGCGSDI